MANFIRNKYNSLDEQVEENKHNIDELINIIKPIYKSTVDLSNNAVSVAISDTNADIDTVDGWLLSKDGYLYKINGGDGTNLLLEYYTQFKGDKGDQGDQGDQGDTGAQGERGVSFRYYDGDYIDNSTQYAMLNLSPLVDPRQFDQVLFKNGVIATIQGVSSPYFQVGNNKTITAWSKVVANVVLGGTESDLTSIEIDGTKYKVGGNQTYKHNIKLTSGNDIVMIYIENDDATPFTVATINQWLNDNNFNCVSPNYMIYPLGFIYNTVDKKLKSIGIAYSSSEGTLKYMNVESVVSTTGVLSLILDEVV